MEPGLVIHPLKPLFDSRSRVLLLGSMPSPLSRENAFYYANPRNRFWQVMAGILGRELPQENEERARMLLDAGIALWDVLASCTISGASDASIADPVPNDLSLLLDASPIQVIFATGGTAASLYRRLIEPELGRPIVQLPSTSPANARMGLDALIEAYRPICEWL